MDRARLAPVGWVAEPAGAWAGRRVEGVYDPRHHQVALVRHRLDELTRGALADSGYRRIAVDACRSCGSVTGPRVTRRLDLREARRSHPSPRLRGWAR